MSISDVKIGRQGYIGLAIESVAGTPESAPSTYIPFTDYSVSDKHEPIADIASRASRLQDYDAVTGKKWGEGDIEMSLDATQVGYLLKLAFGTETVTAKSATPPVHDHNFYVTASGNAPKTATLWVGKGVDVKKYSNMAVDTFELDVSNEGLPSVKAGFIGGYPATSAAPAMTTVSGTLLTWKDLNVKFGSSLAAAGSATATKLTSFKVTMNNNVEPIYRAGSSEPDLIATKQCEVTGEFTVVLEDTTQLENYRNLSKQAIIATFTGANLGTGGYTEQVVFQFNKVFIEEAEIDTGIDDYYMFNVTFRAIWNKEEPGFVSSTVRNGKSTVY